MKIARKGGQIPKVFQDKPTLLPGLGCYMKAFLELSTCRAFTIAGPGPIPWDAIDRYATQNRFDEEDREELFELVRALDNEYLEMGNKSGG